jgi:hypothetical protein
MQTPHDMNTISNILEKLRIKKMDTEFRWTPEGFCAGKQKCYQPEDLEIVKVYRFEGISDPADMAILYIIEAKDGLTGYSLDAYATYSDHDEEDGYDNFVRRIPTRNHDKQLLFEL